MMYICMYKDRSYHASGRRRDGALSATLQVTLFGCLLGGDCCCSAESIGGSAPFVAWAPPALCQPG